MTCTTCTEDASRAASDARIGACLNAPALARKVEAAAAMHQAGRERLAQSGLGIAAFAVEARR